MRAPTRAGSRLGTTLPHPLHPPPTMRLLRLAASAAAALLLPWAAQAQVGPSDRMCRAGPLQSTEWDGVHVVVGKAGVGWGLDQGSQEAVDSVDPVDRLDWTDGHAPCDGSTGRSPPGRPTHHALTDSHTRLHTSTENPRRPLPPKKQVKSLQPDLKMQTVWDNVWGIVQVRTSINNDDDGCVGCRIGIGIGMGVPFSGGGGVGRAGGREADVDGVDRSIHRMPGGPCPQLHTPWSQHHPPKPTRSTQQHDQPTTNQPDQSNPINPIHMIQNTPQVVFLPGGKVLTVHKPGELHVYDSILAKSQVHTYIRGGPAYIYMYLHVAHQTTKPTNLPLPQPKINPTTPDNGQNKLTTPTTPTPPTLNNQDYRTLLDIKDEVYSWWDHGLVSAALHPEFPQQPYLYIAVRWGLWMCGLVGVVICVCMCTCISIAAASMPPSPPRRTPPDLMGIHAPPTHQTHHHRPTHVHTHNRHAHHHQNKPVLGRVPGEAMERQLRGRPEAQQDVEPARHAPVLQVHGQAHPAQGPHLFRSCTF